MQPDDWAPRGLPVEERKHPGSAGWDLFADQTTIETHVVPRLDLILHSRTPECVCGPTVEIVTKDGCRDGHQYTHHSLDGRELEEPGDRPT